MRVSWALVPVAAVAITIAACGVASGPESDRVGVELPAAPPVEIGPGSPSATPQATPTTPTPPAIPVGAIERADALVPGFVTITGWADDMTGTGPTEVTAWLGLEPVDSTLASDRWSTQSGDWVDAGFAFDLPVPPGAHVVCVTTTPAAFEPLDCVELDIASGWQPIDDRGLYLTALTPTPDGSVTVRGVAPGRAVEGPARIEVSSDSGRLTAANSDTSVTAVDVVNQSFRFEVADLAPGTWAVCASGERVSIRPRAPTPSAADGCGTVVIGDLNVGTTGSVFRIDAVAPPPDHPLYLMERDGGVSVELRDGSTMWFFGDSMLRRADDSLRFFVNNTAAWAAVDAALVTRDAISSAGEPFLFASPPDGTCAASKYPDAALWPESAVALPRADGTDRVIVVMSKVCVGDDWLDIELVGYAIAEVTYDPADPPIDRSIVGDVTQPALAEAEAGFGRAMLLEPDGFLYGYQCGSYPTDRWGPCQVGRVATDDVTDTTAWRFWDGGDWTNTDNWVPERAAAAEMELPDPLGNTLPVASFGVVHAEQPDAYLMAYSPWPAFCGELAVRVAATPVGPWTSAVPITLSGCGGEADDGHCYTATPQMQLCGPDEFGGGYFDRFTDTGLGQYFTFVVPFVVVPAAP
jgi:hypothetical protein